MRFGESEPQGVLGAYIIWMSQVNVDKLLARSVKSDHMLDITFVYENHRAIYNSGLRLRGHVSRGFSDYRDAVYACEVPKSDRYLGSNEFKIDKPMMGTPSIPDYVIQENHAFLAGERDRRRVGPDAIHTRTFQRFRSLPAAVSAADAGFLQKLVWR